MKYQLIFCFFAIVFFSCVEKKSVDDASLNIKGGSKAVIELSKYADSIRYIELGDTPVPISRISDVLFGDNLIIVRDAQTHVAYFFDGEGNYLRQISNRGRGPGEYIKMSRVMLDNVNKNVMVYDINTERLLIYDIYGNHIRTIDEFGGENKFMRDLINLPSGGYLCYIPDKSNYEYFAGLWEVDSDGKFVRNVYSIDEIYPMGFPQNMSCLYNTADGIGFADLVSHTIFSYDKSGFNKQVSYNMEGKNPLDYVGQKDLKRDDHINTPILTVESEAYIVTEWLKNLEYSLVVVSKKDLSFEEGVMFSYLFNGEVVLAGSSVRNNLPGVLTKVINPYDLWLNTTAGPPPEIKAFSEQLLDGRTEEQLDSMNPIIELIYLKN